MTRSRRMESKRFCEMSELNAKRTVERLQRSIDHLKLTDPHLVPSYEIMHKIAQSFYLKLKELNDQWI